MSSFVHPFAGAIGFPAAVGATVDLLFAPWDTPTAIGVAGIAALLVGVVAMTIRRGTRAPERVLFLGGGDLAALLWREVNNFATRRFRIVGLVDDYASAERLDGGAPWVGKPDQLTATVTSLRPARIVVTMTDRRGRIPEQALLQARLRGVHVEDGLDFYERVAGKLAIESLRPSALIHSTGFRRLDISRKGFWWRSSRAVECVLAAVGLVFLLPLLAIIAVIVRFESRGSAFFVQARVGLGGRPFGLVKFRTMYESTDVRSEWVKDNADRVTRVGRWLRRFRIDEWPQLINVLRGEMSFVGPRPHPASNYRLFLDQIPYYYMRELVRPGITGWAQVRYGYANDIEEETEKMRFDVYYIKHRSLRLDVRILIETVLLLAFDRTSHQAARTSAPAAADTGRVVARRDVKARPALR